MMKFPKYEFVSAGLSTRRIAQSSSMIGALLVLFATAAPLSASAAAYFVRVDGNDSVCNGTANAPSTAAPQCAFRTIQKSANVAVAGDNVSIQPGTFSETLSLTKAGTSAAPILFSGPGATLQGNLKVSGQYTIIDGITISPPTSGGLYAVSISGVHDTLRNCTVTAYGATASEQATAIGFEGGSFNTVEGCTIRDMNDIDVFHVWGHDNTIRNNYVTNIQQVNYNLNHTDFIQSWGYSGAQSYNILVEGNVVTNSSAQLGNTSNDGEAGLHDWTFRNNVFFNIGNAFFWGIPSSRFYNNVFYNVGKSQGYALSLYTQTGYSSVGVEIVNNAFVANIGDVDFHSTAVSQLAAYSNNYFATATFGTKGGTLGTNAVNGGDPKFKSASTGDFHLLTGSVLIGRGLSLASSFTTDGDGNTRGAVWDIGAFMYGGVVSTTTTTTSTAQGTTTTTAWATTTTTARATTTTTASTTTTTLASPPPATGQSVFTTQTPQTLNNTDGAGVNYELGLRFTPTAAGQIKAIRFYKSPSESGTHIGKIYAASGQLLASVTFSNESASGWQVQNLAAPLAVAANSEYTVSVNTGNSYYVATTNGLSASITSGSLRTPIGGGVYGPLGSKPAQSWQNSNYFRDVVFFPDVPQSLLTSQIPQTLSNTDGVNVNYELGMRFTSTAAGQIRAIRFYKAVQEIGTHVGKIYNANGQLLASATFTGESGSGWQVQSLSTPLNIAADTEYTVSVNTGNTYYVATANGLATQVMNGNLRSVVGNNGVFGPVGSRPTQSWQNSNYFRDVVFVPSP
jgi:hypothetical protein